MSYHLYDPHWINRRYSPYLQKRGQVLRSRLCDLPRGIERRMIPAYLEFFRKNPQFGYTPPNPPDPGPPDPDPPDEEEDQPQPPLPDPTITQSLTHLRLFMIRGGETLPLQDSFDLSRLTFSPPPEPTVDYDAYLFPSFRVQPMPTYSYVAVAFVRVSNGTFFSYIVGYNETDALAAYAGFIFPRQPGYEPLGYSYYLYETESATTTSSWDIQFYPVTPNQISFSAGLCHYGQNSHTQAWYFIDKSIFSFPWDQ